MIGHLRQTVLSLSCVDCLGAAWGLRYALFASLLAPLAFSWLAPPVGYFHISDPRDVVALVAFLFIGILTSYLSDRARKEALNARRSEKELRDLIETIPTMAFAAAADGRTEFLSRGWQDYAGLSVEARKSIEPICLPTRNSFKRSYKRTWLRPSGLAPVSGLPTNALTRPHAAAADSHRPGMARLPVM